MPRGKAKTKFEYRDLDLMFKCHEGHLRWQHMQDGFPSISEEIFDASSQKFVHRSNRAM